MIVAIVSLCLCVPPPAGTDVDGWLDAIATIETGGQRDPDHAVGDGGKALGRYQIWRSYWLDACEYDRSLRLRPYTDVTDPYYARRVIVAYLSRYCKAWTLEAVARIHNGGPNGCNRRATVEYASKVAMHYRRIAR